MALSAAVRFFHAFLKCDVIFRPSKAVFVGSRISVLLPHQIKFALLNLNLAVFE